MRTKTTEPCRPPVETRTDRFTRRRFLAGAGGLAGAAIGARCLRPDGMPAERSPVVIARAEDYDHRLEELLTRGLGELGFGRESIAGKVVLLKPNLVEPSPDAPHINTNPLLVRIAAEVFRRWDAREVVVAEGQGHCRDSYLVLEQSGLADLLDDSSLSFVDLNHDEVFMVPNELGKTLLTYFYLPKTIGRADIVVSMPKLKTHHWVGTTLSMKNLFGVMPGIVYGWPKNVLHQAGIPQSILDITGAVKPYLAIVDGIVGMEGDGPVMGQPRRSNLLIMGRNPVAVDATGARLIGLDPRNIPYLSPAPAAGLGPIEQAMIEQRGEPLSDLVQEYKLLDHPHMRAFRP